MTGHSYLDLKVSPQPTDTVCGPTCLHGLYAYFKRTDYSLDDLISQIQPLPAGGTLAVQLGCHALENGFDAYIYTNNLQMFDPTWFRPGVDLADKLRAQAQVKHGAKHHFATQTYLRFLELGGEVHLESITPGLIRRYLDLKIPLLAGLSATYLYECAREMADGRYDDVAGAPAGHFVLIHGYDEDEDEVKVADPLPDNPAFESRYYTVEFKRLLTAIALGIITYDANILVIAPQGTKIPLEEA